MSARSYGLQVGRLRVEPAHRARAVAARSDRRHGVRLPPGGRAHDTSRVIRCRAAECKKLTGETQVSNAVDDVCGVAVETSYDAIL
jgi:hypothetical protein